MRLGIDKSKPIEDLIQGCLDNSQRAQRDLYDRYSSLMFSICLRYVGDTAQAEDIMIAGFMKIFANIKQFLGKGSFEGWMRRIMVNEALAFIRKNKSMYLEVDIQVADYEPDYGLLGDRLEADDLMRLVNDLPVGYKTIFNLYAIEGYAHKEIADMLGISVNTSKSQLSRARTLLQSKLIESERILNNKAINHE
ncbi:sigma-70 family RNA polymerase sigma factor [Fulvivirgaceae bacterium BMA12]|uniref:Sigma-70 family RNA polymerase sigma factor n=1 Tax=Agaribacillus aureus TaxID=3051825 RepID=A0ABT8LEN6_9BACT|nr:sigma-70 family RNA polymerase sigma factor [Fulvivirgaceae bacterium BMA12]